LSDDPILTALTRLEAGQARLEAGQADTSGRLTRLEAGQADTSGRLTRLGTGQESLRTDFRTLRTDFLEELGTTPAAIMERIDRVQDSVSAIRDEIAVNFGAVNQARRVNDNTRDELRGLNDVVARMMTLILRLQTDVAELKGKPAP
jgi:chromosome segregation ATPase